MGEQKNKRVDKQKNGKIKKGHDADVWAIINYIMKLPTFNPVSKNFILKTKNYN